MCDSHQRLKRRTQDIAHENNDYFSSRLVMKKTRLTNGLEPFQFPISAESPMDLPKYSDEHKCAA
jgi:hypothetical protein